MVMGIGPVGGILERRSETLMVPKLQCWHLLQCWLPNRGFAHGWSFERALEFMAANHATFIDDNMAHEVCRACTAAACPKTRVCLTVPAVHVRLQENGLG